MSRVRLRRRIQRQVSLELTSGTYCDPHTESMDCSGRLRLELTGRRLFFGDGTFGPYRVHRNSMWDLTMVGAVALATC